MRANEAINCSHLYAGYTKHLVFKDLNISIQRGSLTAIVGPNGSGKSTLLKLVAGAVEPRKGSLTVLGKHVVNEGDRRFIQHKIGYVPQRHNFPLIPISVEESVLLGLWGHSFRFFRRAGRDEHSAALETLSLVGMDQFAHRDIRALSGGQYQRTVLARALVRKPELLLLDEPTTHLDGKAQEDLLEQIAILQNSLKLTVLIVTHEKHPGACFDQVLYVNQGTVYRKEEV